MNGYLLISLSLLLQLENKLKENAEKAVQELGIEASVEKIEYINVITGFGVMMTPALAVDGEVKVVGKVSTPEEIKQLLA